MQMQIEEQTEPLYRTSIPLVLTHVGLITLLAVAMIMTLPSVSLQG